MSTVGIQRGIHSVLEEENKDNDFYRGEALVAAVDCGGSVFEHCHFCKGYERRVSCSHESERVISRLTASY